jgi:hypothetical protein
MTRYLSTKTVAMMLVTLIGLNVWYRCCILSRSSVAVEKPGDPKVTTARVRESDRATVPNRLMTTVPTLAKVVTPSGANTISGCCHILLYYGLGPTDLPFLPSGIDALRVLTHERDAIAAFGRTPFVRTRNGLRYHRLVDPISFHIGVGESHRDQCLATFASVDLPLDTPIVLEHGEYTISDLLSESMANFSYDEKELAWTAIAYAKYLPPRTRWVNRFDEHTSFSELVLDLMRKDLAHESCMGTHILQALVRIEDADRARPILEANARRELDHFLTGLLEDAVLRQEGDGSWPLEWCGSIHNNPLTEMSPLQGKILVSGHLAEIFNGLDDRRRPRGEVYTRVAGWLKSSLTSGEIKPDVRLICPFTHAAGAAREILGRAR